MDDAKLYPSRPKCKIDYIPEWMLTEQVRPVPGFSRYYISESGVVYRHFLAYGWSFFKRLKTQRTEDGYDSINLSKPSGREGGLKFHRTIHRLVAEAFLPPPEPGQCVVRHLDGIRSHNHYTNLAWGTYLDNSDDARRHGTLVRGEQVGLAKLREDQVRMIRLHVSQGAKIRVLARTYGVDPGAIRDIRDRKTWRHIPEN